MSGTAARTSPSFRGGRGGAGLAAFDHDEVGITRCPGSSPSTSFEEDAFPPGTTKITSLLGQSEATADIQKLGQKNRTIAMEAFRVYGDGNVPWGNPGEDKIL